MSSVNSINPHRRTLEVDEDEDAPSGSESDVQGSKKSKRPRLNDSQATSLASSSRGYPLRPNINHSGYSSTDYQPGSIVRIKLTNFVTYTSAEFFPGPSLNMVIGPNGTGKSTLVCAICLGLGWGPQHLGRAKDVAEFVKHGCEEATIEIELAADPQARKRNNIVQRNIIRDGNKSTYFINGKKANQKIVVKLAKTYSIQIDNLCQFLPQDKVAEFAGLTPIELLHSTMRAAAPEVMLEWHESLKKLRGQQKQIQAEEASDREMLANYENRQQLQRGDVERMQQRVEIQEKVKVYEAAYPLVKYRDLRVKQKVMATEARTTERELAEMKASAEPALKSVNQKQIYCQRLGKVVENKKEVRRAEGAVYASLKEVESINEQITNLDTQLGDNKKLFVKVQNEKRKTEQMMTTYKHQLEEPPIEFDVIAHNQRGREKKMEIDEIASRIKDFKQEQRDLTEQGTRRNAQINDAKLQLENLASQVGQRNQALSRTFPDTAKAWAWIQQNQDVFESPVYGPPIVECSVKDPRHADLIESLFQRDNFSCFTVQNKRDFGKLQAQLYGTMKLSEITIRTAPVGLDRFKPPATETQLHQLGLEGWALDYMEGPEPVLAMLCDAARLHQTGVSLRETSDEQYSALEKSQISTWVAGKHIYQITRRREYGPGAVSTRVRDVRPAQIWTTQPVDTGLRAELMENIEGWGEEVKAFDQKAQEIQQKIEALRLLVKPLHDEINDLNREKDEKQKAISRYKSLPTKLASEKSSYAEQNERLREIKATQTAMAKKELDLLFEKCQAGLNYAQTVDVLRSCHISQLEAELMHIEANSDFEVLSSEQKEARDRLTAKTEEYKSLNKKAIDAKKECTVLKDTVKQLAQDDPDLMTSITELGQITFEELEANIDSAKAQLEVLAEGNDGLVQEFEARQEKIDKLRQKIDGTAGTLSQLADGIKEIRDKWEPELDKLISEISDAFSHSFEMIGCAGEVSVDKADDFDQWAISIKVKFRAEEELQILDSHRQSGGERAVSTIFYLMALQSLARCPFRVVDEINQGMDPRNERMVHGRMVEIACEERGCQYFLVTPKLLNGLRYHPKMRVMCVASGDYMPDDYNKLDFGKAIQIARAAGIATAAA
ncbi:MAG: Structural maintenance of chromosomes protein 5 [Cirrosporium novae-zelandiae]|nr:MAG: Structural maintenance of chromosomes protein 5 [Cirrosporium novae-zelandiae]